MTSLKGAIQVYSQTQYLSIYLSDILWDTSMSWEYFPISIHWNDDHTVAKRAFYLQPSGRYLTNESLWLFGHHKFFLNIYFANTFWPLLFKYFFAVIFKYILTVIFQIFFDRYSLKKLVVQENALPLNSLFKSSTTRLNSPLWWFTSVRGT